MSNGMTNAQQGGSDSITKPVCEFDEVTLNMETNFELSPPYVDGTKVQPDKSHYVEITLIPPEGKSLPSGVFTTGKITVRTFDRTDTEDPYFIKNIDGMSSIIPATDGPYSFRLYIPDETTTGTIYGVGVIMDCVFKNDTGLIQKKFDSLYVDEDTPSMKTGWVEIENFTVSDLFTSLPSSTTGAYSLKVKEDLRFVVTTFEGDSFDNKYVFSTMDKILYEGDTYSFTRSNGKLKLFITLGAIANVTGSAAYDYPRAGIVYLDLTWGTANSVTPTFNGVKCHKLEALGESSTAVSATNSFTLKVYHKEYLR